MPPVPLVESLEFQPLASTWSLGSDPARVQWKVQVDVSSSMVQYVLVYNP